jgi:hypothetical protein
VNVRVGGDAGDIIDGDVGEDGRTVSVGKGNRQSDYSNRLNVNFGDETSRLHRNTLSNEERIRQLEQTVYGEERYGVAGILQELRSIKHTTHDIQRIVHHRAEKFDWRLIGTVLGGMTFLLSVFGYFIYQVAM